MLNIHTVFKPVILSVSNLLFQVYKDKKSK